MVITPVDAYARAQLGKPVATTSNADLEELVLRACGSDVSAAKYSRAKLLQRVESALSSGGDTARVVRARSSAPRDWAELAEAKGQAAAAAAGVARLTAEVARLEDLAALHQRELAKYKLPASLTPAEAAAAYAETEGERVRALKAHLVAVTDAVQEAEEARVDAQREHDQTRDLAAALARQLEETRRALNAELVRVSADNAGVSAQRVHDLLQAAADATRNPGSLAEAERGLAETKARAVALHPTFVTLSRAAFPRVGDFDGADAMVITCLSCSEVVLSSFALHDSTGEREHGLCLDCAPDFFRTLPGDAARMTLATDAGVPCSLATAAKPCCMFRRGDVAACITALGADNLSSAGALLENYANCLLPARVKLAVEEERRRALQEDLLLRRKTRVQQLLLLAAAKCPGCGTQTGATELCEHVTCPVDNTHFGACCCGHANVPDVGGAISACIFNPFSAYMNLSEQQKELLHLTSVAVDAARLTATRFGGSLGAPSQEDLSQARAAGLSVVDNLLFPSALETHPAGARVLSGLKDLAAGRAVPILPRVCTPFLNMTSEEMLAATDWSIHSKERHVSALLDLTPGDNAWLLGFIASHCAAFRAHLEAHPETESALRGVLP
jgi:hypothetical protein